MKPWAISTPTLVPLPQGMLYSWEAGHLWDTQLWAFGPWMWTSLPPKALLSPQVDTKGVASLLSLVLAPHILCHTHAFPPTPSGSRCCLLLYLGAASFSTQGGLMVSPVRRSLLRLNSSEFWHAGHKYRLELPIIKSNDVFCYNMHSFLETTIHPVIYYPEWILLWTMLQSCQSLLPGHPPPWSQTSCLSTWEFFLREAGILQTVICSQWVEACKVLGLWQVHSVCSWFYSMNSLVLFLSIPTPTRDPAGGLGFLLS